MADVMGGSGEVMVVGGVVGIGGVMGMEGLHCGKYF
jgi:hypothetical protein